jgi:hypothetical protein
VASQQQEPGNERKSLAQRVWAKTYALVFFAVIGATIVLWQHDHLWAGRVWSAVFGGVGFIALYQGLRGLSLARKSEMWRPVEAVIVAARLVEQQHTTGSGMLRGTAVDYFPDITFEYEYQGEKHRGNRLLFVTVNWPGPEAQKIMERFPVGTHANAWVDPDDPRRAVLLKGVEGYGYRYATALTVGTVFAAIGMVGWLLAPLLRRL